jgi:hypothetical protein
MANHDEAAIEAEIQAKGKTAPRLTPADIDAQITDEYYLNFGDAVEALWDKDPAIAPLNVPAHPAAKTLTICVLVLRNGFAVTGESNCASPENYDAEIGRKIARDNARNKIWPLEGYRLRSKLMAK